MLPAVTAKRALMALTASLLAPALAGAASMITVKAVEFRGLNYLSKYELVRGVETRAVDGGIMIDHRALERSLSSNGLVAAHKLGMEQGRLVVAVTERVPATPLAAVAGERTLPVELDAAGRIVSKGAWHSRTMPLIVVAGGELAAGAPSKRLRALVALLGRVRTALPALYREIAEIQLGDEELALYLKGRRTRCRVAPGIEAMARLQYVVGYLDRTGRYPESVTVSDAMTVIR